MRTSSTESVDTDASVHRDTLLRRLLTPAPVFELAAPNAGGRAEIEALVATKFRDTWDARVTHFLPCLMSMHCLGHCTGVAGIKPAASGALYLEQYFAASVEARLQALTGNAVPRRDIAEIGNLIASQRGASHLLFIVLTATLHAAGFKWIVFTATRALRNNLEKLGFPLHVISNASPDHLDDATKAEWGRYYSSNPQVVAGNLDVAMQLIRERPLLRRVQRIYRRQIRQLAQTLRSAST